MVSRKATIEALMMTAEMKEKTMGRGERKKFTHELMVTSSSSSSSSHFLLLFFFLLFLGFLRFSSSF